MSQNNLYGSFPIRGCTRAACAVALALAAAACGDRAYSAPEPPVARGGQRLDQVVAWHGDVVLEENDQVVNVLARATVDPRGGFLVSDEQENQIRVYGPEGRLVRYFGRKGEGPKEFRFLYRAIRLPSGSILGIDNFERMAEFDSTGASVIRSSRIPVGPLYAALLLNDSTLLLGGRPRAENRDGASPRLHVWSLTRDTLVRSFFSPGVSGEAAQLAANTAGFVGADHRGDTIAAVFALSDTVYFFDAGGTALGQIPLQSKNFRRLSPDAPLPDPEAGVVAAREWVGSFSMMSDVFWMADGTLLVQYQDRVGPEPRWRLRGLRRDGTPLFEVHDSPYLIAVDAANDWLYFVKPGEPAPNVWSRARLVR